jgi:hypothetical protein
MPTVQPIMSGSPGAEPLSNPAQQGGFFSRIGAFLKTAAPYIQPIADRLAAAAGNYAPMELERQQREDALRQSQFQLQSQLQQSQLQNQDLQRQLTQKQLENYQTPEQAAQTTVNVKRAETPTTYAADNGQVGIADTDLKGVTSPRMVTLPNPAYAQQQQMYSDVATKNGPLPAVPPPPAPPTFTRPAMMPQSVGFHISGYDANGNPTVAEYSKSGVPMGNAAAPTPTNVAVPTSPWKTYLETGRKQGMSDADIVNRWNTQESQRTNVKMVPQPDGTISAVPVTEGSVSSRGALGTGAPSGNPSQTPPPPPPPPLAPPAPHPGAGNPGRTVGGHATKPVTDAFTTYNQSQERFNVMQNALPDALAGDQQAMLNLLANHLGMTMGLQKGARLNQALIEEAQKSTPWLQGMQAKFDSRGYLSGVTLTPQQMNSMVKLAQSRADQDFQSYQRAQGAAKGGYGMNGTPSAGPNVPPTMPKIPPRTADDYLNSLPH